MLKESIFTSVNNLTRGKKTELTGEGHEGGEGPHWIVVPSMKKKKSFHA
jgi:hypothetical protein